MNTNRVVELARVPNLAGSLATSTTIHGTISYLKDSFWAVLKQPPGAAIVLFDAQGLIKKGGRSSE